MLVVRIALKEDAFYHLIIAVAYLILAISALRSPETEIAMNRIAGRLHPSIPKSPEDAASSSREWRRPGSWCQRRRELLMLTSIASLTLMLVLAKLPAGSTFFTSDERDAYLVPPSHLTESLPLITAQEILSKNLQRPVERFQPDEVLPESDLIPDELTEVDLARPGIEAPVAHRHPTTVASLKLHDLAKTARFMQTAIRAPVVDDPPKLRIGSLLIEYPMSALKKAVEGLVIVRFTVETDGRAYGINVVSGLEPACDAAVVDALRDARFVPGKFGGRNVPALSQLAVRFRIDDGSGFY